MQYVCIYIHITYILHITCLRCYSFLVICYYGLCKLYIGFKQIHVIQCGFICAPCLLYVVSGRCHVGSMWLGTHPLSEHVARYSSVFSRWLGVQSLFHQVTRSLSLISLPSLDVCMPRNKFGLEQRSCPVRMKHLQQHTGSKHLPKNNTWKSIRISSENWNKASIHEQTQSQHE